MNRRFIKSFCYLSCEYIILCIASTRYSRTRCMAGVCFTFYTFTWKCDTFTSFEHTEHWTTLFIHKHGNYYNCKLITLHFYTFTICEHHTFTAIHVHIASGSCSEVAVIIQRFAHLQEKIIQFILVSRLEFLWHNFFHVRKSKRTQS
jgi:hypothetical protein